MTKNLSLIHFKLSKMWKKVKECEYFLKALYVPLASQYLGTKAICHPGV